MIQAYGVPVGGGPCLALSLNLAWPKRVTKSPDMDKFSDTSDLMIT